MVEKGVVHARFQILHLKQMEYLLAAKMRCKKLYIGISHPDIVNFASTSNLDVHGITKRDNPMTYIERFHMLQAALVEFKIKKEQYEIVPFPISKPDLLSQYAPPDGVYYMSLMTEWDEARLRTLDNLGLKTQVIWDRNERQMGLTSSDIKLMIAEDNDKWQMAVPKSVKDFVKKNGIDKRIKDYHIRFQ